MKVFGNNLVYIYLNFCISYIIKNIYYIFICYKFLLLNVEFFESKDFISRFFFVYLVLSMVFGEEYFLGFFIEEYGYFNVKNVYRVKRWVVVGKVGLVLRLVR